MQTKTKTYTTALDAMRGLIGTEGVREACRCMTAAAEQALVSESLPGWTEVPGDIRRLTGELDMAHPPHDDHGRAWKDEDGQVVAYTSEPYTLTAAELRATLDYADAHGLSLRITGASPHQIGGTMLLIFTTRK